MPQRLKKRQKKIQEKRKKTPWRKFVMEVASWRSLSFYKNQGMVSIYPPLKFVRRNILHYNDFDQERISFTKQGKDVNGKQTFFEQLKEVLSCFPIANLRISAQSCENVAYCNVAFFSKDCYLSSVVVESEKVLYTYQAKNNCNTILHSFIVLDGSEYIYNCGGIINSRNVFYSRFIQDSRDIWFSTNLINCQECLFCNNLQNVSYHIHNKSYDKDEYLKLKKQYLQEKSSFHMGYTTLSIIGKNDGNNVQGNYNRMGENIEQGYYTYQVKNARNVMLIGDGLEAEHAYDVFSAGMGLNHFYGVAGAGYHSSHIYCSTEIAPNCHNVFYSMFMDSCSYCLGCIGLKNKSFCIFNKQYTKEEWFDKVDEIFTQMEKDGVLGDFFPGSMNPFYFNDTAAYLIDDSFTKEEVEAQGYLWRDEEIKVDIPEGLEVVDVKDLGEYEEWRPSPQTPLRTPQSCGARAEGLPASGSGDGRQRYIDPSILKKVIRDEQGNVYRIVKMEYDFLMKHGLPLPRLHRLERLKMNFKIK